MIARLALAVFAILGTTLVTYPVVLWQAATGGKRYLRALVGLDNAGSAALLGSDGRTTISARAAKARDQGARWGCVLCRVLDAIDPDHCDKSL